MSEIDIQPLFDEDEDSIRARMSADLNLETPPESENYIDDRTGSMYQIIEGPKIAEFARLWDALSTDVPSAALPTRAWGDYLDEWVEVFDMEPRKAAVKAKGIIRLEGSPGVLVASQTSFSAIQSNPDTQAPEFVTTDSGVIPAEISAPANLVATAQDGGTLPDATYYYKVTAINIAGETLGSSEANAATATTNNRVQLTWDPVPDASGYKIYRSTATGDASKRFLTQVSSELFIDQGLIATTSEELPTENTTEGVLYLPIEAIEEGIAGNVGANAITAMVSGISGVTDITNPDPTEGGTEVEDDEDLRTRFLLHFQGSGSGNEADYTKWCLSHPGVGKVTVVPNINGLGTVGCILMTTDGDPVSDTIVDDVQWMLDPLPGQGKGLAGLGHTVYVMTPAQVTIDIIAVLELESGYSLDNDTGMIGIRDNLDTSVQEYVNQLQAGEDVIYGHVMARLYNVDGVHRVTSLEVNGGTIDIAVDDNPAEVAYLSTTAYSI